MNKRQWLKQQGFEVGKRGRFSQAMLDALAGAAIEFTDKPKVIHTKHGDVDITTKRGHRTVIRATPQPEIGWTELDEITRRDLPAGYVVRLPNGHTTSWTVCNKCSYSIKFCCCPRPAMPPWLDAAVTIDILT